jgi:hypothetical protein
MSRYKCLHFLHKQQIFFTGFHSFVLLFIFLCSHAIYHFRRRDYWQLFIFLNLWCKAIFSTTLGTLGWRGFEFCLKIYLSLLPSFILVWIGCFMNYEYEISCLMSADCCYSLQEAMCTALGKPSITWIPWLWVARVLPEGCAMSFCPQCSSPTWALLTDVWVVTRICLSWDSAPSACPTVSLRHEFLGTCNDWGSTGASHVLYMCRASLLCGLWCGCLRSALGQSPFHSHSVPVVSLECKSFHVQLWLHVFSVACILVCMCVCVYVCVHACVCVCVCVVLGWFELKALCLLGRRTTIWTTPLSPFLP